MANDNKTGLVKRYAGCIAALGIFVGWLFGTNSVSNLFGVDVNSLSVTISQLGVTLGGALVVLLATGGFTVYITAAKRYDLSDDRLAKVKMQFQRLVGLDSKRSIAFTVPLTAGIVQSFQIIDMGGALDAAAGTGFALIPFGVTFGSAMAYAYVVEEMYE
ncbi:hypothetical protein G3I44_13620 [Halogeometricum borinquense]|uniref:Uncharacterized protein n=1 Tax=Halogeometricum borinquense TaxID=60847 RepID=A0A6C0UI98_9EURY|nr:hypothetical protein [Halogeometricum borinquense]QIB75232.1 hypothetical protein G3I44_13620 [Halogeometricum borinquense]